MFVAKSWKNFIVLSETDHPWVSLSPFFILKSVCQHPLIGGVILHASLFPAVFSNLIVHIIYGSYFTEKSVLLGLNPARG